VAFGAKEEEAAVALVRPWIRDTVPTAVPPLEQPEAPVSGPHTKKLTVPDGTPSPEGSETVAVSLTVAPSATALAEGTDVVLLALAAKASGAISGTSAKATTAAAAGQALRGPTVIALQARGCTN
jgi:hypothetical protein